MIYHLQIKKKVKETPTVFSMYFDWEVEVFPGQFVMVWVPGYSEIPMTVATVDGSKCITVKVYGKTTEKLSEFEKGDILYLRGPYGKPFTNTNGEKLLIGGGSGMASLRSLIDENATGIIAAKTGDELLFENAFSPGKAICVTEDGSKGIKGLVMEGIKTVDLTKFKAIYVCGPEMMMKSVFEMLKDKNLNVEFSFERSMKCGIGLCDSCSIDGLQVCKDGPTFNLNDVRKMYEFGRTKLSSSGKRIYMK
ncbi:dihydroorotate dehydrogenase electron transfer subunit [Cuniculiplasma sp. SKW3]|uniref:dihydroorotate dehydrogenase electron transfer subunit n=1 Tax=unclassified Cuniculiplasma TaxID=2619706 RepID=UPI003FCF0B6B